ncbi:uncharacterized protein LOC125673452 isoform X2 [Ostrea edulis]|uniref:uncharacterized protein LOC125673452 isoform X2 n=1 Tax=Ostrea edulis TaxID=37623 RepID=UPI0024AF92F0|nr:uncharacterized protein LOC125673452 isoform X2 [Ostrea edulis]
MQGFDYISKENNKTNKTPAWYEMNSFKIKLLFLGLTISLCELIPQSGAVSSHCGLHASNHFTTTRCNNTHCTKYYKVTHGRCLKRILQSERNIYTKGKQLFLSKTYTKISNRDLEIAKDDMKITLEIMIRCCKFLKGNFLEGTYSV